MGEANEYCCGLHEICEKNLIHKPCEQIEYYDDEELDAFKGRMADSYSVEEIRQFREVLETMYPSDVSGWVRSLRLRDIKVPDALKEQVSSIIHSEFK